MVSSLELKSSQWYEMLHHHGMIDKIYKSYAAYIGAYYNTSGHEITYGGEVGEITQFAVNHYRNIAQHIIVNITSVRPSLNARSINTDYKSLVQANLAESLLDYYMREKKLEKYIYTAVEYAVALSAGYILMEWSPTSGKVVEINEELGGVPIYEGDVTFSNLSPLDVYFDMSKESFNDMDWVVCRTFKNRYSLMAKFPHLADKISGIESKDKKSILNRGGLFNDTDDVPVYTFMHKRTEATPNGVYCQYLSSDCVLIESQPLPYREIPLYRVSCADILGTPMGYTPLFDLLPIQDAVNGLYSTVLTNQNAFGVQSIFVPEGSNVSHEHFSGGGMMVFEGRSAPQPINFTQTPAEVFNFIQTLERQMETISGINSVARGNPNPNMRSGTALALVQSQAIQFMSGLQGQYVRLVEDVGTSLINLLKDYAKAPRVAEIVGKSNKTYVKEFTGDDLQSINRIVVDLGNPLTKTTSGRIELAEQMLQYQIIKDPRDMLSVLNTGNLANVTEGVSNQLMLIRAENEKLLNGEKVTAIVTDFHVKHIEEHSNVLADPEARNNPDLTAETLAHIQDHINLLRTTDPQLLMLLGQQPLQQHQLPPEQAGLENTMGTPEAAGVGNLKPAVDNLQQIRLPEGFEGAPLTPQQNMEQKNLL